MIFYPNTYLRLLAGVPLANDYKNTMTFTTEQLQIDYFTSKAVYSYDKSSYQRSNPALGELAAIRVPLVAEKLYNINYIMFRNNNFGTKWFYAFVKEINYINDGLTELIFELDIMQTWLFDFVLKPSWILREHTNNDAIGANIIPENLELGDMVYGEFIRSGELYPYQAKICVAASFDKNLQAAQSGLHGFVYNGICLNIFDNSDDVDQFIQQATTDNKADGILSIFMVPQFITDNMSDSERLGEAPLDTQNFVNINIDKTYGSFGNYTPKNNKLYTYPYNYLTVLSGPSNIAQLHYEYFNTPECGFGLYGELSLNPQLILVPLQYNQPAGSSEFRNLIDSLSLSGFPQCSYICDTYKMIFAQSEYSTQMKGVTGVLGGIAGMIGNGLMGNWGGAINSAVDMGADLLGIAAKREDEKRLPPTAHAIESDVTAYSIGYLDYRFANAKIRESYARTIDEYFTMYGYRTNRLKIPNMTGRRYWNYVQTAQANIVGNVPAPDLRRIIQIFDRGITFWHTTDVGNYNLNNTIVGG